jgi:hypothetical protein
MFTRRVKRRVVQKADMAVAVAVTRKLFLPVMCLLCSTVPTLAGVLPDDRVDQMYHSYDGGGVEITGPSVLVLKKIGQNVAVSGNYYVDSISSASIDVVTTASKYTEERTEVSVGADYMHGNSIMSVSYTNSDENDYQSDTASFGVSMDMFGNMTTVSLGYARSWDTVENNNDPSFSKDVDRQNYKVGLSQVLTKDMIMEVNYEAITDEGFLNNPYRSARYLDPTSPIGYSYEPEVYPNTRTSNAVAVRALYYLSWRAATYAEYRFFNDTWDITANNIEVGYVHPLGSGWILEGRYRYYTQNEADFYSDLFPRQDSQNFVARDKELSEFTSNTIGFTVSYDFVQNGWYAIDRGSINFAYDHIMFDYDDFRDLRDTNAPVGKEPLYDFTADVAQVFVSIWF